MDLDEDEDPEEPEALAEDEMLLVTTSTFPT
jgi:hypothetical protein